MDRRADEVLIECGHGGMCAASTIALWRRAAAAPLCRVPFVGVMLIVGEAAGTVRAIHHSPLPTLFPLNVNFLLLCNEFRRHFWIFG
jgi:hypothetical protein